MGLRSACLVVVRPMTPILLPTARTTSVARSALVRHPCSVTSGAADRALCCPSTLAVKALTVSSSTRRLAATASSSHLDLDGTDGPATEGSPTRTRYTITCPPTPRHTLTRVVTRNCQNWNEYDRSKPIALHTRRAFQQILPELLGSSSVVLDSGCGTGRSSRLLGTKHPDSFVVGVDRSLVRLSRSTSCSGASTRGGTTDDESESNEEFVVPITDNVVLVRAELGDFWRLLQRHGIPVDHHYLLYPNPYPKLSILSQRWYGHPAFPLLATLHRQSLTVRSNWPTYLEEFAASTRLVYRYRQSTAPGAMAVDAGVPGGRNSAVLHVHPPAWIDPSSDEEPWTHFEAKYQQAGEPCYELLITTQFAVEGWGRGSRRTSSNESQDPIIFDVIIIGGGVVGLSILRHATLSGYSACVVERESSLAAWASGSNSGIVCTGVDAPPNSLERALIRESISTIRSHCKAMNVPIRECGSLVCRWTPMIAGSCCSRAEYDDEDDDDQEDERRLDEVLELSHAAGDTHARRLGRDEVLALEPNVSPHIKGAVHIPGEFVVDPWLYTISLAAHARENGATIHLEFDVDLERSDLDEDNGTWTLWNRNASSDQAPRSVMGRSVVNASGVWSDQVEQKLSGGCDWTSKPRRGQYLVFAAPPVDLCSLTRPIQQVPSLHTKGVFLFSSMYNQIVVGPTAAEQCSRDDRTPDPRVRRELSDVARCVMPALYLIPIVGEYVGIRPATDRRDYQIRLMSRRRWVACGGIRSTGLTASLGIGRHVVHLLQQDVLPVKSWMEPALIRTTPLPPVHDLVLEYQKRKDGRVTIHGHEYTVTHPLTILGWNEAQVTGTTDDDGAAP